MKIVTLAIVTSALVALASASASAQIINFDTNAQAYGGSYESTAFDGSKEIWNKLAPGGTGGTGNFDHVTSGLNGIYASDGTPTNVTFTDGSTGFINSYGNGSLPNIYYTQIETYNIGTTFTDSFNHVDPTDYYDVYMYSAAGTYSGNNVVNFTLEGNTLTAASTQHSGFIAGNNYVEFTNVTASTLGTISFNWEASAGSAVLSGVSLVDTDNAVPLEVVPEPSTWALMLGGLASLFFIVRARRSAKI